MQLWPAASSGGPCGPRHPNPQLGDGQQLAGWSHMQRIHGHPPRSVTKNFGGRVQLREALLPPFTPPLSLTCRKTMRIPQVPDMDSRGQDC